MQSFQDKIGQLYISPFPLYLYSTMDLVKTLSTRSKQYSVEGITKPLLSHFRKVSSKLNSVIMQSFHDEIGQLCISPFPFYLYSTMNLGKTLSTRAKKYSVEGITKSLLPSLQKGNHLNNFCPHDIISRWNCSIINLTFSLLSLFHHEFGQNLFNTV